VLALSLARARAGRRLSSPRPAAAGLTFVAFCIASLEVEPCQASRRKRNGRPSFRFELGEYASARRVYANPFEAARPRRAATSEVLSILTLRRLPRVICVGSHRDLLRWVAEKVSTLKRYCPSRTRALPTRRFRRTSTEAFGDDGVPATLCLRRLPDPCHAIVTGQPPVPRPSWRRLAVRFTDISSRQDSPYQHSCLRRHRRGRVSLPGPGLAA